MLIIPILIIAFSVNGIVKWVRKNKRGEEVKAWRLVLPILLLTVGTLLFINPLSNLISSINF
jgi:membrane protein CcdC involved in cytochrome C biogenesis